MSRPSLEELVAQAEQSELFTAPRLEADVARFLREHGERMGAGARGARPRAYETVYFVGSGGSWSAMYSGKYLADRFIPLPSELVYSYELCWRAPRRLGPRALVFLASYSGQTEDTLAALECAKRAGARTIALAKSASTPLSHGADAVVAYDSSGLYTLPALAASLFVIEYARAGDLDAPTAAALDELQAGIEALPAIIGRAYRDEKARCEELARAFLPSDLLYCVGAGPLYGLAYKFALTVFMENIRTHGSVVESAEFRHGPAEMLERQRADMVFLLGSDEARAMTERSLAFARQRGARAVVFDAAGYEGLHPLLTPYVLKVPLQWFVAYSALLCGILDLDERVFMGHRVLSDGRAGWP
ncbi:MAG: SIS domain-containing protein [Thermoleophilia bacterium]